MISQRFVLVIFAAVLTVILCSRASFATPETAPSTTPAPQPQAEKRRPLWDYGKELNLSDKQVADIKTSAQDLESVLKISREKLLKLNAELVEQVDREAPMDQIKTKLEEIAAVQIVAQLANIRATRALTHILTPQQLSKWREILQQAHGS